MYAVTLGIKLRETQLRWGCTQGVLVWQKQDRWITIADIIVTGRKKLKGWSAVSLLCSVQYILISTTTSKELFQIVTDRLLKTYTRPQYATTVCTTQNTRRSCALASIARFIWYLHFFQCSICRLYPVKLHWHLLIFQCSFYEHKFLPVKYTKDFSIQ